jgi:hypothetical protein
MDQLRPHHQDLYLYLFMVYLKKLSIAQIV